VYLFMDNLAIKDLIVIYFDIYVIIYVFTDKIYYEITKNIKVINLIKY